ncbi:pumilio homolog 23 [Mercurialis annua]|uniref:pumilio homolog 23 n=1 Tax=Mercurialis annua TaxID=3986 RepID=UPI00215E4961|nr:pumilio homolog 23 [Mercurialis annua]XP_050234015.1 pumilio homolog 23 [Mercurialis annua]
MVAVGSKALILSTRLRNCNLVEDSTMGGDDYKHGRKKKDMGRKNNKQSFGFDGDDSNKSGYSSGRVADGRPRKSSKYQGESESMPAVIRQQVDPETMKYFSEIANLFESNGADLEERSAICSNALEEAVGKEFELATDYIISHTMQSLLEGCDVDHLCSFLRSCANKFPLIAMDRSGSHVAETALRSLALHLEDNDAYSVIEETLTAICKAILASPVDMMCNCHGSHVLRSLLCLCGGVPLDSREFHGAKPSTALAVRLNLKETHADGNDSRQLGFPNLLKFLVSEMLKCSSEDIQTLQVDQYSSLVLQAFLKLLDREGQELVQMISTLLGSTEKNLAEGSFIDWTSAGEILELMKETAYSHLMEVVLEVSPEGLYDEMFTKIFRSSLFELSSHRCSNFVIQALVSHARNKEQMESIWEELGPKFKDLLEMGMSGVIASLIAACQRHNTLEHQCCQALAAAVCLPSDSPKGIVPHILFLESYFALGDKSSWNWPNGIKMHVMGSLILQTLFRFQSKPIQPFITSLTSMEVDHVLHTAKDAAGARAIEAFLGSNASSKKKLKLIAKLQGHFGELALHSSGSYTIEKCFAASSLSLREAIASDLLAVQNELYKTKQGPYLLRKLEIDRFAYRPEQWKFNQASKQSTYDKFSASFGSSETKPSKIDSFLSDTSKTTSNTSKITSNPKDVKTMQKEIDNYMSSNKYSKKGHTGSEAAGTFTKAKESINQVPFLSGNMQGKKRHAKDKPTKSSKKSRV